MKKYIAALLMAPVIAHAGFFTGNQLLEKMSSNESFEKSLAMGFVLGVHDSFEAELICTGARVTSGQLRDIVKQYLQNNPAQRDLSAGALVVVSLAAAFPCAEKKGDKRL